MGNLPSICFFLKNHMVLYGSSYALCLVPRKVLRQLWYPWKCCLKQKRGVVILDSQLNEIVIIKVKHIFTVFKFARKIKHWGNADDDSKHNQNWWKLIYGSWVWSVVLQCMAFVYVYNTLLLSSYWDLFTYDLLISTYWYKDLWSRSPFDDLCCLGYELHLFCFLSMNFSSLHIRILRKFSMVFAVPEQAKVLYIL